MNLKKTVAIALAVLSTFAFFGCGNDSGKQGVSIPSQRASINQKNIDEATVKSLMKKMESPNLADKIEACPVEKLPGYAMYKTSLGDSRAETQDKIFGRTYKFNEISVSEIKQEGDFALVRLSYTTAENKMHTITVPFARIDGKWGIDFLDCKSVKPLEVAGYDSSLLEAAANLGYTHDNEIIIVFDVRSKTGTKYFVLPVVTLITDQGEFPLRNTSIQSTNLLDAFYVTSVKVTRLNLPFKDALGTPKALRFAGFNETDSRGIPINGDVMQVMTFKLSE